MFLVVLYGSIMRYVVMSKIVQATDSYRSDLCWRPFLEIQRGLFFFPWVSRTSNRDQHCVLQIYRSDSFCSLVHHSPACFSLYQYVDYLCGGPAHAILHGATSTATMKVSLMCMTGLMGDLSQCAGFGATMC